MAHGIIHNWKHGWVHGWKHGALTLGASNTTLSVTITDSVDPVISSVNFDYSVVVNNTGGATANNVVATITLDPTLTYVTSSGSGWATGHSAGVVTCTRAALAPGAAPTISITVTTAAAASTESTTADADADNSPPATQDVETTVVNLVDRDATSGKRVPSSLTQWTNFNAYHVAIGTANFPNVSPFAIWLLQEASGNPADSSGNGFTLTASAGWSYQQAVTGWTRLAMKPTAADGSSATLTSTSASLPSLATESMATLVYKLMPAAAPGGNRNVVAQGTNATRSATEIIATPLLRGRDNANTADGAATPASGDVRPIIVMHDNTADVALIADDREKLLPTYSSGVAGTAIHLGAVAGGNNNHAGGNLVAWSFRGANAEVTAAGWKALQTALGWTPAWS